MAISHNVLMQGVRGTIGKQVVFRTVAGRTIVSAYPNMERIKRTAKQKTQNERMKKVNAIIAEIKADPELRNAALLRLDVPSNKLHHALVREQLLLLSQEG